MWRLDQDAFKAWRQGLTGYQLVDAGGISCHFSCIGYGAAGPGRVQGLAAGFDRIPAGGRR
jgi:hypothetical protein